MPGEHFRTPLGRVRGLGSAGEGTSHFIRQRLTAIANVPLVAGFLVIVVALSGESHATVVAGLSNPLVAAVMLAAIASVVVHMRIGMQVIIEDYVHGELSKLAFLVANTLFAAGIAILCFLAILKIAFGG